MHEAETHIPILFNAGLSPRTPGDLVIAFFGLYPKWNYNWMIMFDGYAILLQLCQPVIFWMLIICILSYS